MRLSLTVLIGALLLVSFAHAASITALPSTVLQGEPFMVTIDGADMPSIASLTFGGKRVGLFLYQGKPTALIGIDLAERIGEKKFVLQLTNGEKLEKTVMVVLRPKLSAPLGIPEKLGGNTKAAQDNLVTTLAQENAILTKVKTTLLPMWGDAFKFPVKSPEVIDVYGYSRSTGSYAILHKGTDFRANTGTPVKAINGGIVRLAREFTVYGKTVVIDHGGGVQSLSLHLSKISVNEGQKVSCGQTIGLSGESGYALGPHLHLSVRVSGISIDPMKFFALLASSPL